MTFFRITLIRSAIGLPRRTHGVLKALGLKKRMATVFPPGIPGRRRSDHEGQGARRSARSRQAAHAGGAALVAQTRSGVLYREEGGGGVQREEGGVRRGERKKGKWLALPSFLPRAAGLDGTMRNAAMDFWGWGYTCFTKVGISKRRRATLLERGGPICAADNPTVLVLENSIDARCLRSWSFDPSYIAMSVLKLPFF
uniref:Large ribosomal subunit protein uL30-like ferredoxin-like fold domain-containing protein n=1 Tax=Coccidioides posadasii RMSCC 3488 TaxID=454284 RepID=A0A0J6F6Y4_COCPO|nr:hypothetical protein CPAG_01398 [Coccidioides posadasii RMSCC 3488]